MKLYANVDIVNRRLASHGMKVNFLGSWLLYTFSFPLNDVQYTIQEL